MPKPCGERERLKEAYFQANLNASALVGAVQTARFGPAFVAALDKAEAAGTACNVAKRLFEEHCKEHGCEAAWHGPL